MIRAPIALALLSGMTWHAGAECCRAQATAPIGIFEGHGDVGKVLHSGSATFDHASKTYTLSGSGENMWSTSDSFHFLWKKASGDLSLAADVWFV